MLTTRAYALAVSFVRYDATSLLLFVHCIKQRKGWRVRCYDNILRERKLTVSKIAKEGNFATLQKKCKALYDYSRYVATVKGNLKKMPKDKAIDQAVNDAIKENLLNGLFKRQKMEVLNMSLTEFDQEEYDRNRRQEGYEEGIQQGSRLAKLETARNLLAKNIAPETIAECTGLDMEEVLELSKKL